MNRSLTITPAILVFISTSIAWAQAPAAPSGGPSPRYSVQGMNMVAPGAQAPVSYASVTEVNGLLAQLEASSKNTQTDLTKLRVERWKTDSSYKRQSLSNVDSIQRNLQDALPEMIAHVRSSPDDLPATFKLYRNLDALYDVLGTVAESAGAFGPKDDFQSLSNDLSALETVRKAFAERIQNLSQSKEAEISRLRTDLKAAQAAIPAAPAKKLVVDDAEPPKKPATKKKTAKKPPATTPQQPPASGQQTPPTQPQ